MNQDLQHQALNPLEMPIATKTDETVDPNSGIDRRKRLADILEQNSDKYLCRGLYFER